MIPKIIIAGPGRCGTSFLTRLLTHIGCDTGFTQEDDGFNDEIMGGCEIGIRMGGPGGLADCLEFLDNLPRIIKSPDICWMLADMFEKEWCPVEHVFLPIRNSVECAYSRIDRNMLWFCDRQDVDAQATVHRAAIGSVVEACILNDVPFSILRYPDFLEDVHYCWRMLQSGLDELDTVPFEHFQEVFYKLTERRNATSET